MPPFHRYARLGRPGDFLPWNGRAFGVGTDHPGYEMVDTHDSHVLFLIGDGSIVYEDPPEPAAQPVETLPHPDP